VGEQQSYKRLQCNMFAF